MSEDTPMMKTNEAPPQNGLHPTPDPYLVQLAEDEEEGRITSEQADEIEADYLRDSKPEPEEQPND
jgi:hypothetical protein